MQKVGAPGMQRVYDDTIGGHGITLAKIFTNTNTNTDITNINSLILVLELSFPPPPNSELMYSAL